MLAVDQEYSKLLRTFENEPDYFCFVDAFPMLPMSTFVHRTRDVNDFLEQLFAHDEEKTYTMLTQIDSVVLTKEELEEHIKVSLCKKRKTKNDVTEQCIEWKNALIEQDGFWIVCFYPLQIARRFHCSKQAKIFIMDILQHMNPLLGPRSDNSELEAICWKLSFLRANRPFHFEEFLKVSTYKPIQQQALCVHMSGVVLSSQRFSAGFGPLESLLHEPIKRLSKCQWRECFEEAWINSNQIALNKSGNLFTDTKEFQNALRQKLIAFGTSNQVFKQILCASNPLRLVYIDKQDRSQHAFIWEQVRAEWLQDQLPLTLPVWQFNYLGVEQTSLDLQIHHGTKFVNIDYKMCGEFLYGFDEKNATALDEIHKNWREMVANRFALNHSVAMMCAFCDDVCTVTRNNERVQYSFPLGEQQMVSMLTKHSLTHGDVGKLQIFYSRCSEWIDYAPRRETEAQQILQHINAYLTKARIQIVRVGSQGCIYPVHQSDVSRGVENFLQQVSRTL